MRWQLWLVLATSALTCKCAIADDLLEVYAAARAADPVLAAADAQRGAGPDDLSKGASSGATQLRRTSRDYARPVRRQQAR